MIFLWIGNKFRNGVAYIFNINRIGNIFIITFKISFLLFLLWVIYYCYNTILWSNFDTGVHRIKLTDRVLYFKLFKKEYVIRYLSLMVEHGMVSFIFRSYVKMYQAKGLIIILILRIISCKIVCIRSIGLLN